MYDDEPRLHEQIPDYEAQMRGTFSSAFRDHPILLVGGILLFVGLIVTWLMT